MTSRLAPYAFPIWALFLVSALLFGCVAAFAEEGVCCEPVIHSVR